MKTPAQLAESIDRFQTVFWEKRRGDRALVGVVDASLFLPIKYARRPLPPVVLPEHVTPDGAMTDYEFAAAGRRVSCDDWMPFVAAWRAVPWLEAACGCPVRCAAGSMAAGHIDASLAELAEAPLPAEQQWLGLMASETARLADTAPHDCWISPSILRGPSDVLAAMRGLDNFYRDLYDDAPRVEEAAKRINRLLLQSLQEHFGIVQPKLSGYGHIYGYWAPGPTVVLQEDVLGMCAPAVYRDRFLPHNARIVESLGGQTLFHLHSTGYRHWREVLSMPGLAGLELTVEAGGPTLADLLPVLREVLERSRLILYVDGGFAELADVLPRLPREGLYVLLREQDVPTDNDFRRLVAAAWRKPASAPRVVEQAGPAAADDSGRARAGQPPSAFDRVLAACRFQPPDRIPRFDSFWEFPETWRQRLGDPAALSDVAIWYPDETPFPTSARPIKEEGGYFYERDAWGRTIRRKPGAYFVETLQAAVGGPADLDRLAFDSPELDARYLTGKADPQSTWPDRAAMAEALRQDKARHCIFAKTGGPYLRSTYLRGEADFLADMAGNPPFACAVVERMADHLIAVGVETLHRWDLCSAGIWIYDDMAGNRGPMFGPRQFEQVLLPAYRRMIAAYKVAGARYVFLHSDGDLRSLLEMLVDAGIDGLNPLERRANMDLTAIRRRYPRLILAGGMCNTHTLVRGTRGEIEAEAREIIDLGRHGGVIIGTHSISPEVPLENFVVYHDFCHRYGAWT
jgi:hypothetical protein